VEPYLIASCLRGVIAQRLVRKVCVYCATGGTPVVPTGCPKCLEGYAGRIGVFEFLPCGPAIADAIHGGHLSSADLLRIASSDPRYCSMREDAHAKLRAGLTTQSEVLAAIGAP